MARMQTGTVRRSLAAAPVAAADVLLPGDGIFPAPARIAGERPDRPVETG
ncbi:MAG TPA: hypothetical protein VF342_00370 [Alphaproteobacteria bacterium]